MSKTLCATEENARFDVVLMDLQMPIMDGLESTSRLRKLESVVNNIQGSNLNVGESTSTLSIGSSNYSNNSNTTITNGSGSVVKTHQLIIGCSANSDNETMQAAFVAGIDAFIPKPFNIASFNETVSRYATKNHIQLTK